MAASDLWLIAAASNLVMIVAYAWLALVMYQGIAQGRQWRTNPIAVATFVIFVTCTIGHGFHLYHALEPYWAPAAAEGLAARAAMADPLLWSWEVFTAVVALFYLTLRKRLKIVHAGAALCEDMVARQRQAAAIHDSVVAGLRRARTAAQAGQRVALEKELDAALTSAKGIITNLLGERGSLNAFGPGDLRRRRGKETTA